jgi:tetratricopeptide (TPR) repeat protein
MKSVFRFFIFCFLLFFSIRAIAQQHGRQHNRRVDSLIRLCREPVSDTIHLKRLMVLCDELWRVGSYDTSLVCINDAIAQAQKTINSCSSLPAADTSATLLCCRRVLSTVYSAKGMVDANSGKMNEAIADHHLALRYARLGQSSDAEARAFVCIGEDYRKMGTYPIALENYFAALKIVEATGNKRGMSYSYNNIGAIYYFQKNYDDAIKYYNLALQIRKEINDRPGISYSLNNIANVQAEMGQYQAALDNFSVSLQIKKEVADLPGEAGTYLNIASVYEKQGSYDLALVSLLSSLKLRDEMHDLAGMAACNNNIGQIYLAQKRYDDAKKYFLRGLELGLKTGSKEWIKDSYSGLAGTEEKLNDDRSALEYYKKYILYRDSLVNEENTRKTVQAQLQYEFGKRETETKAVQEKKDALAAADARKQQIILWSVAAGLALVMMFALFIYRSFLQKQKINIEISRQKEMIEEKQKEILDSIHYARRIQRSLLPSEKYISRHLK